jgi:hypothetical protein
MRSMSGVRSIVLQPMRLERDTMIRCAARVQARFTPATLYRGTGICARFALRRLVSDYREMGKLSGVWK